MKVLAFTDIHGDKQAVQEILKKAEKAQEVEEIANILVNIGVVHSKQGKYELSIRNCQKAIDIASE